MSEVPSVIPWRVSCSCSFPNGASGNIPSRYHPTLRAPSLVGHVCSMSPPNNTPGLNLSCVPVALISILVPFVMRSINRRNDASCSCRPGESRSSDRMLRRRRGREERREVIIRSRNWVAPSLYFRVRDVDLFVAIVVSPLVC